MMGRTLRVNVRLSESVYKRLVDLADSRGVSYSTMAAVLIGQGCMFEGVSPVILEALLMQAQRQKQLAVSERA